MKYKNSLKKHNMPNISLQPNKNIKNIISKLRYTFSFVEGKDDTCLAVFMKERLNGRMTEGKSHFRVEVDSRYTINVCSVDDYGDFLPTPNKNLSISLENQLFYQFNHYRNTT